MVVMVTDCHYVISPSCPLYPWCQLVPLLPLENLLRAGGGGGAGSCEGRCGAGPGPGHHCYCDLRCSSLGDCCEDFTSQCLHPPPVTSTSTTTSTTISTISTSPTSSLASSGRSGSCAGLCGGTSLDCYCDSSCLEMSDCCPDFPSECGAAQSCSGRCGEPAGQAHHCHCDPQCRLLGDCCEDFNLTCRPQHTCRDRCEPLSPLTTARQFFPSERAGQTSCYCDPHCAQVGDCCPDYEEFCQAVTTTSQYSCKGRCKDKTKSLWRLSERKGC